MCSPVAACQELIPDYIISAILTSTVTVPTLSTLPRETINCFPTRMMWVLAAIVRLILDILDCFRLIAAVQRTGSQWLGAARRAPVDWDHPPPASMSRTVTMTPSQSEPSERLTLTLFLFTVTSSLVFTLFHTLSSTVSTPASTNNISNIILTVNDIGAGPAEENRSTTKSSDCTFFSFDQLLAYNSFFNTKHYVIESPSLLCWSHFVIIALEK